MSLSDLYQEIILEHSRKPHNFGPLPDANREARGYNPLCGDMVVLHLRVRDERIEEAKFEGAGCAISTASASMMTDVVRDRTIAEARGLADRFRKMVSGEADAEAAMGQLVALQGVRAYPMRVKCATLPWHALTAALDDTSETVTTE